MVSERRIRELVERAMESSQTPEQVCAEDADLLTQVAERLMRLREVEGQIEALFPTPDPSGAVEAQRRRWRERVVAGGEFPQIPGYRIESLLGSGGMGVVYKATHLSLKRQVAIKMLLMGAFAGPRDLACLLQEAQAVAGLHHPGIVRVFDVGEFEGLPYFTMEYVEGGTLAQKLAGAPLPSREAAELVATVAAAVYAAHRGGVVHRDLKPSNILLTLEGAPTVADFSLARSDASESAEATSNPRQGTPSYMAPEQALGKTEAYCPAVDIYALGAVLYEALTGRPPFRGESSAETVRQVIESEPVPPSRLNGRVPRDLETVCLTCLRKDPRRRYSTAAAVEDDLRRFLRGEPIAARPVGRVERAVKWVRRRPAQATAIAAVNVFAGTLIVAASWFFVSRAEDARAVAEDLRQVERSQSLSDWAEARTALARAKGRLGGSGWRLDAELTERVAQAEADLAFVARLDGIRLCRFGVVDGKFGRAVNRRPADTAYAEAFREAGLVMGEDEAASVIAARVRGSRIRTALTGALDDWAACNSTRNPARLARLLEAARLSDVDAGRWRDRVRDPSAWTDAARLSLLAEELPEDEHSLALLAAVGERLDALGVDSVPFLRRLQRLYPSDFWTTFSLGLALGPNHPAEAARYFQAALAVRPDVPVVQANLGIALATAGQIDEGIEWLRSAVRLQPNDATGHSNLGNGLLLKGLRAEATAEYRRAVELDDGLLAGRTNLAKALFESGDIEGAVEQYNAALKIAPDSARANSSFGLVLRKKGLLDEALARCERAVELEPEEFAYQLNLGLVLVDLGRRNEAVARFERAVELAPSEPEGHVALGRALLSAGRSGEAQACFREALQLDPCAAAAHHGLGMIAGDSGDFAEAISRFNKALECDPAHLVSSGAIGRVLMVQGRFAQARDALQRYVDSLAPTDPRVAGVKGFIRQCDGMLAKEAPR